MLAVIISKSSKTSLQTNMKSNNHILIEIKMHNATDLINLDKLTTKKEIIDISIGMAAILKIKIVQVNTWLWWY